MIGPNGAKTMTKVTMGDIKQAETVINNGMLADTNAFIKVGRRYNALAIDVYNKEGKGHTKTLRSGLTKQECSTYLRAMIDGYSLTQHGA